MDNQKLIKKFAQHYQNVDRAYGKHPAYKFNDTIFFFGEEKDMLKEKFEKCFGDKVKYLGSSIKDCIQEIDGTEYMRFHISWYDTLKSVIGDLWLIDNEEVFYNFYQK